MAAIINTNIASLNAQRNLTMSQSSLATALQRLSSGLRINSAKDDAAGMAISDRMTAQINGLNQATRNANDGISLAQTAEGGIATATDLLQRMRQLAVQSSNSTNSNVDRASLQAEVAQLKAEIDRVARSTNFNGISLLDGSFTSQNFQVGANNTSADRVQISSIANMQASSLGLGGNGGSSLTSGKVTAALALGDLVLNGVAVGKSDTTSVLANAQAGQTSGSAWAIARAINEVSSQSGVNAVAEATYASSASVTGAAAPTTARAVAAGSFSINGVAIGAIEAGVASLDTISGVTNLVAPGANVAAAINKISDQTHVIATATTAGIITLTSTNNAAISVTRNGSYAAATFLADTGLAAATTNATLPTASAAITANSLTINGVGIAGPNGADIVAGVSAIGQGANVAAAINLSTAQTGVTALVDATNGAVSLVAKDGRNIVVAFDGTLAVPATAANTGLAAGTYRGTVSLNSANSAGITVAGAATGAAGLGDFAGQVVTRNLALGSSLGEMDVSTAIGATNALGIIDAALAQVDSARAAMGAYQNRFSSVVSNLAATAENLTASRSRIQDTDFAAETSALTRAQILQQAGTAMLAQANALPQQVLSLLK